MTAALLIFASIELVSGGQPRLRIVTDGSARARFAADLIRRHAVLMTGVAVAETGTLPALSLRAGPKAGYEIRADGAGAVIEGRDLVRAAYDLLEAWGCRFDPVSVPKQNTLALEAHAWRPKRKLWVESRSFDPSLAADGVAVHGLPSYRAARFQAATKLGFELRVASLSFDDFLAPTQSAKNPEWFALRNGKREARGNFALQNPEARAAYLDALAAWLDAHPEVGVVGIWPEVTTVWCEEALAAGAAESYALLWRDAAKRFPSRRFEILATGLTLRPPEGRLPANVEVRLRPGRDASALQGLAGQKIDAIVKAWEVRGATVVLEIDAAPESWCGMPWPCHDAIRANASRFTAAVLRRGRHAHARLWREPGVRRGDDALLEKAGKVASWGHPADAAELFFDARYGVAFHIATTERLLRIAVRDKDRDSASDVYLGYLAVLEQLGPKRARTYRRYRARDIRTMMEELLPEGAVRTVGPAKVTETFFRMVVETDTLRLEIDREKAAITSVRRFVAGKWSDELAVGAFDVVALKIPASRAGGSVTLSSPGTGKLRIDLTGKLRAGGPSWRSRLDLASGSGIVRQAAEVSTQGGIALGFRFSEERFDRWVCPAHAAEGRLSGAAPSFPMPANTLVYCRDGEDGIGVALRLPSGGTAVIDKGLIATRQATAMQADWIVFAHTGELGK